MDVFWIIVNSNPIFLWFIIFLIAAVPAYLISWIAGKKSNNTDIVEPVGLAGWLILLVIRQTLSPFQTLVEVANNTDAYSVALQLPNGHMAVYGEVVLLGAFFVLEIIVTIAMYRKRQAFPKLFLYQWYCSIAVFFLDMGLVSIALNIPSSQIAHTRNMFHAIEGFLAEGLWVWYVFKSVRVRNTFIR